MEEHSTLNLHKTHVHHEEGNKYIVFQVWFMQTPTLIMISTITGKYGTIPYSYKMVTKFSSPVSLLYVFGS